VSDLLAPSEWTVTRARRMAGNMVEHVDGDTFDAVEHFIALCEHLDELYGGYGFTRLLEPSQRTAVAGLVRTLRGRPDALHQPVNSSLSLDAGRVVAEVIANDERAEEWLRELGRATQGLYGYLDELYGGPGAFTELLDAGDRARVADLVVSLTVT
jgi:hypothetical protein